MTRDTDMRQDEEIRDGQQVQRDGQEVQDERGHDRGPSFGRDLRERERAEPGATERETARPQQTERETTNLFAADRAEQFRGRWTDVQGRFVDDPRGAVKSADALVEEVLKDLGTMFRDERTRLDQELGAGERPDTEHMRVAIRRYRTFFERLLAV